MRSNVVNGENVMTSSTVSIATARMLGCSPSQIMVTDRSLKTTRMPAIALLLFRSLGEGLRRRKFSQLLKLLQMLSGNIKEKVVEGRMTRAGGYLNDANTMPSIE